MDAKEIIRTLAEAGKSPFDNIDVEIERKGKHIILPNDPRAMAIPDAINHLQRKYEEENQQVSVHEIIDAYPEDALIAFNDALRQIYGWATAVPQPGFFGPRPPQMITISVAHDKSVQVPYGAFSVPGVENPINVVKWNDNGKPVLVIYGDVKKRDQATILEIAQKTREILKEKSIYRGKAIRLRVDDDGDLDMDMPPEFINTREYHPEELILNDDERVQVETALWAVIRNTEACVKHGVPLKRGILLEGVYGTGKTMTAAVTSHICEDHGWTYILLDDVRGLRQAIMFAKRYEPAVIFAEDVDRVIEERDQDGNDLLNTIDGALTKNSKVITVLTTNHVEKLDRAMLRPGRLDAVIAVRPPEPKAVGKLIRLYGRGLVAENVTLNEVGELLAGQIPATIREVVERSKLAMIASGRDKVLEEDLIVSAKAMRHHLDLLAEKKAVPSAEERLGQAFREVLGVEAPANGSGAEEHANVMRALRTINRAANQAANSAQEAMEAAGGASGAVSTLEKRVNKTQETVSAVKEDTARIKSRVGA